MVIDGLLSLGGKLVDKLIQDPEAKAKAQLELAKLGQSGELAKIANETELFKEEQSNLTARHKADMASDSWLSKNIRPATLVFILVVYTIFGLMSAWEMEVNQPYVELLGQWGMLIMSFYFGGRTLEKIIDMRGNSKKEKE